MPKELPKSYIPKEYEDQIYERWESSGLFNPDNIKSKDQMPSFTVSMPPPNATGVLHVGHTLGLTIQDIMIRYHRMKGEKSLWLPGVDHAAIATQNVVEKILRKEDSSRHALGREKFLERVEKFVAESKSTIENQTRKIGSSCDWSREAYTMSEALSRAVKMQFKKMYDDGLIYRGDRIVNWCPRCQSTLADDEVEHKEQKGLLYTFKYDHDFPIAIATTRPETKLGDTAVAVNPDDKRYQEYIGQLFRLNFVGVPLEIKIIGAKSVEQEFGTGALGVTPAHSLIDWQLAEENKLGIKKVIGQDGKILPGLGEYTGLKVAQAREKIVESLKNEGLLIKQEEIINNLSVCYRCGATVEPLPSLQWFIGVDKSFTIKNEELTKKLGRNKTTLKEIARFAVESGEIEIVPERFKKVYYQWMDNLRDWCISRQIWFGHRVPVYYRKSENSNNQETTPKKVTDSETQNTSAKKIETANNNESQEIYVGLEPPAGEGWRQDEDTLDTWFSSALWTWSTLLNKNYEQFKTLEEWIGHSPDLKNFHPTSVMETMHDILFFWVARMIMMTLYTLNEVPFKTVYLHGMVCDKNGNKMSKSKPETCIEPIEVSRKYGTDALRLSLIIGNSPGNSLKLSEQKIAGFRNFANKLWNIGRFIQLSAANDQAITNGNQPVAKCQTLANRWIVSKINNLVKEITADMDNYRFSLAGERLYDFAWHELADWYIEITKLQNNGNTYSILNNVYLILLKLLHPFTPFVTETIWQYFHPDELLMAGQWPEHKEEKIDKQAEQDFEIVKKLVIAVRAFRQEQKIEQNKLLTLAVAGGGELVEREKELINALAKIDLVTAEQVTEKQIIIDDITGQFTSI